MFCSPFGKSNNVINMLWSEGLSQESKHGYKSINLLRLALIRNSTVLPTHVWRLCSTFLPRGLMDRLQFICITGALVFFHYIQRMYFAADFNTNSSFTSNNISTKNSERQRLPRTDKQKSFRPTASLFLLAVGCMSIVCSVGSLVFWVRRLNCCSMCSRSSAVSVSHELAAEGEAVNCGLREVILARGRNGILQKGTGTETLRLRAPWQTFD